MAKYIIKLERGETAYKTVNSNGKPMIQLLEPIPYFAPNIEQVREEAKEEGYRIGYDEGREAGVQQGLDDAWEAARKIAVMPDGKLEAIFGTSYFTKIFTDYSASEAIEKIRQYEQEQEEQIQVGDEVEAVSGKAVVVYVDDVDEHKVRYVYSNGVYAFNYIDKVTKTGRHFPEIAEVLAKMKGERTE